MNRDEFEKLFPVPTGVQWSDKAGRYTSEYVLCCDERNRQNDLWQGFQSGAAIRALKGGE